MFLCLLYHYRSVLYRNIIIEVCYIETFLCLLYHYRSVLYRNIFLLYHYRSVLYRNIIIEVCYIETFLCLYATYMYGSTYHRNLKKSVVTRDKNNKMASNKRDIQEEDEFLSIEVEK